MVSVGVSVRGSVRLGSRAGASRREAEMHARLIVLLDKRESETSHDARQRADSSLMSQGFTGEGGLFASPPSDWFVIGGRWSGCLTRLRLDPDTRAAFWEEYENQKLDQVSRENPEEKQRARAQEYFRQFFPEFEGEPPVNRDSYQTLGYEDDAQILDKVLYEFLFTLKGYIQVGDDLYDGNCFVDLDDAYTELSPDSIGKKWCIVVDFHS